MKIVKRFNSIILENKKNKFEVGDKVKIPNKRTINRDFGIFYDLENIKTKMDVKVFDLPYWTIKKISPDGKCDFNELIFSWVVDDLVPYEDEPEEQDYEEWVDESVTNDKLNNMIGRRVRVTRLHSSPRIVNMTGVIVGYVSGFMSSADLYYLVDFDKEYDVQNVTLVQNYRPNTFDDYREVNLPFSGNYTNTTWIDGKDNHFTLIDDNPEEQDYEEWTIDETNNIEKTSCVINGHIYRVGDMVKHIVRKNDLPLNSMTPENFYEILNIHDYGFQKYLIIRDNDGYEDEYNVYWFEPPISKESFQKQDVEEQDYEEWNEKKIIKYEEF